MPQAIIQLNLEHSAFAEKSRPRKHKRNTEKSQHNFRENLSDFPNMSRMSLESDPNKFQHFYGQKKGNFAFGNNGFCFLGQTNIELLF